MADMAAPHFGPLSRNGNTFKPRYLGQFNCRGQRCDSTRHTPDINSYWLLIPVFIASGNLSRMRREATRVLPDH